MPWNFYSWQEKSMRDAMLFEKRLDAELQDTRLQASDIALTTALCACVAIERRVGRLPATLAEAMTDLGEVPVDPNDGRALRYDPTRRVIWSVGLDRTDQNGELLGTTKSGSLDRTTPDLALAIPH